MVEYNNFAFTEDTLSLLQGWVGYRDRYMTGGVEILTEIPLQQCIQVALIIL